VTTPFLIGDISADEGLRLKAYGDPLTGAEPWTCGYGCTGPDIGPETVWSLEEARQRRDAKLAEVIAELDAHAPWWRSLCDVRQDVLANMAYNLGWPRLAGFHHALAAIQAHDYATGARQLLESAWARQVKGRARRLAEQMRTGLRVAP